VIFKIIKFFINKIKIQNKGKMTTNDKTNISLTIIQDRWKLYHSKLNKLKNEYSRILTVFHNLIYRLNFSYQDNIYTYSEFKIFQNKLDTIYSKIQLINLNSKIKISEIDPIFNNLLSIKIQLFSLISKIGYINILDALEFINTSYPFTWDTNWINWLNVNTIPISIEFYEKIENLKYSAIIPKKDGSKEITFDTLRPRLELSRSSLFTKSIIMNTLGFRSQFNENDFILIIHGYFIPKDLDIFNDNIVLPKKNLLENKLNEINSPLLDKYIDFLTIRDLIIYPIDFLIKEYQKYEEMINLYKDKKLSNLVKDFLITNPENQRYIISLLLNGNTDQIYLGHLLFDLITAENAGLGNNLNAMLILKTLSWKLQKDIKDNCKFIESMENKLKNYDEEQIPYDKRITYMKVDDKVKLKAMEKYKEIQNSKNGETNAKSAQYLDGLLKIPFGIFRNEWIKDIWSSKSYSINIHIDQLISIIIQIEENYILSDPELLKLGQISELCQEWKENNKGVVYANHIIHSLNNSIKSIDFFNYSLLDLISIDNLSSLTIPNIKILLNLLKIANNSKKKDMILSTLINKKLNLVEFNILLKKMRSFDNYYLPFQFLFEIPFITNIKTQINHINNLWNEYQIKQKEYFLGVDNALDNAVYGMIDAKKKIKRVVGQWVVGKNTGYVFGFEGPPGTGKTTIAKQGLAQCLADSSGNPRPFVFIPLGGSANGATLEGHNYTYVGSMWGRIVDGLMESKCMNPIIYIDELDKVSKTEQGREIIGILTHLTDPSQHNEFYDKYFAGVPIDLSKCLIIFTYNDASLIDKILLDRIQRVYINPLAKMDKLHVCKNFIIPEILENLNIVSEFINISDEVLTCIIDEYTYEAGARKLKEKLYEIYREVNLIYLSEGSSIFPFEITKEFLYKCLDPTDKITIKRINNKPQIGVINGLYATSYGVGGITLIQISKLYGSNHLELKLTGQQGDVMKESMSVGKTVALGLIKSELTNEILEGEKFTLHIHCPEGGTPKDGPSAGVAITICLLSILTNLKINNKIAITGEIDLRGKVLAIGGLESKIDGGKMAGCEEVLCPIDNIDDLEKIRNRLHPPEDDNFKVNLVSCIEEVIRKMIIFPEGKTYEDYFK